MEKKDKSSIEDILRARTGVQFNSSGSESDDESFAPSSNQSEDDPDSREGRMRINHRLFPFHRGVMEEVLVAGSLSRLQARLLQLRRIPRQRRDLRRDPPADQLQIHLRPAALTRPQSRDLQR